MRISHSICFKHTYFSRSKSRLSRIRWFLIPGNIGLGWANRRNNYNLHGGIWQNEPTAACTVAITCNLNVSNIERDGSLSGIRIACTHALTAWDFGIINDITSVNHIKMLNWIFKNALRVWWLLNIYISSIAFDN